MRDVGKGESTRGTRGVSSRKSTWSNEPERSFGKERVYRGINSRTAIRLGSQERLGKAWARPSWPWKCGHFLGWFSDELQEMTGTMIDAIHGFLSRVPP